MCEISKKLSRTCGIFFKVRHLLPTSVLVSLYNSLFSSFLQRGIIVWGLTYEVHTKAIYPLQKRVVSAITFKSFTSLFTSIFSKLKILRFYDLFQLKLLTFVYELVNKISPVFFHNFFKPCQLFISMIHGRSLKAIFFMTQENTSQYGLRSVRYAGAKCWNNIPHVIKQSLSVTNFCQ